MNDETYRRKQATKVTFINEWLAKIGAAKRVKQGWSNRFKIDMLYQYYEGFQTFIDNGEIVQPYVINLIYSTIEQKLPSMLFDNPNFTLRPRPYGTEMNLDEAIPLVQTKEDALNFISSRAEFGLSDKHELAVLDAFFGFGVIETGYSDERVANPNVSATDKNPLNNLYCKQIPFDTFYVAANANWDLSTGKWWGYWEWVPADDLKKYSRNLVVTLGAAEAYENDFANTGYSDTGSGKIPLDDGYHDNVAPAGCVKVWFIEDFDNMERLTFCFDNCSDGDQLLLKEKLDASKISVLRYGKRRKGWYPLPPVYNWISPQDEINDIHQTYRIHRKRFSRKYAIPDAMDDGEVDKFIAGGDGTCFKVPKAEDRPVPIEDAGLDTANQASLSISYNDMNRITGSTDEERGVADRQTATQSAIINNRAQIRDSKQTLRVANFLTSVSRNILRALGKAPGSFWVSSRLPEGLLGEMKQALQWKKVPSRIFKTEDYDIDLSVSSISPIYQAQDKKIFMEFLAILTQYEILSMSPGLIREAAYRLGYKNSTVLKQFQELAQLAAIGRVVQAKAQLGPAGIGGQQPSAPGQLPQQQTDASTPPDSQSIMNLVFNRQGVQQ